MLSTNSTIVPEDVGWDIVFTTSGSSASNILSISFSNVIYGCIIKPLFNNISFTVSIFVLLKLSAKHTFIFPFSTSNGTH